MLFLQEVGEWRWKEGREGQGRKGTESMELGDERMGIRGGTGRNRRKACMI